MQSIKQQREGVPFDAATCRDRAVQIGDVLSRALAASIWNANFSLSVMFDAAECEAPIKRRSEVLESDGVIECGNCGQLYDAKPEGSGNYFFVPHSFSWDCGGCGSKREILQSYARDGSDVSCECGRHAMLKRQIQWVLEK